MTKTDNILFGALLLATFLLLFYTYNVLTGSKVREAIENWNEQPIKTTQILDRCRL